jgi:hypothetical protein
MFFHVLSALSALSAKKAKKAISAKKQNFKSKKVSMD